MDIPKLLKGEYDADYQEQLNQELQDGLNNGVYNQEFTTAEITALISATTRPVIRRGTLFFNTDLGKLQVVVTAADPSVPSNGAVETVTST